MQTAPINIVYRFVCLPRTRFGQDIAVYLCALIAAVREIRAGIDVRESCSKLPGNSFERVPRHENKIPDKLFGGRVRAVGSVAGH